MTSDDPGTDRPGDYPMGEADDRPGRVSGPSTPEPGTDEGIPSVGGAPDGEAPVGAEPADAGAVTGADAAATLSGTSSSAPPGDRIEPGGASMDEDSSPSDVPSPVAATPDLADPPREDDESVETTPGHPPESGWVAPVTSIPGHGSSLSNLDEDDFADEPERPEISRPVTAVPDASMPIPRPPVTRAPLGSAFGYPARFAHAPGTGFQLALPQLGTIAAGSAVGSMIAGISASVVALAAGCLLFLTPLLSVAASVLATFCAGGAFLLAGLGIRQIRRGVGEFRGTGMAVTGISCASVALAITLVVFLALITG